MKTKKLKCIITGKTLFANSDYYQKKIERAGSEEKLHSTYICREAKQLLKSGFTVEKIRDTLNVDDTNLPTVPQELINEIVSDKGKYISRRSVNNNIPIASIINTKTDSDVKKFIETIATQEL
jgi:hypothetical protein